jgi:hypothetical protein
VAALVLVVLGAAVLGLEVVLAAAVFAAAALSALDLACADIVTVSSGTADGVAVFDFVVAATCEATGEVAGGVSGMTGTGVFCSEMDMGSPGCLGSSVLAAFRYR